MTRAAIFTLLLAGLGLSGLSIGACSGPTPDPPPRDAGFYGTPDDPWGLNGNRGGSGGAYGTGGTYGGATGGTGGGGKGGRQQERDRDAGPLSLCAAGTRHEGECTMGGVMCLLPAGDGAPGQVCECKGKKDERAWECEEP